MLEIKNLNNIVGQHLHSKWLPKTEGWAVRNVEVLADTYCFELINTQSGSWRQAQIQLKRNDEKWDTQTFTKKWELWGWNLGNNKPEQMWCDLNQMSTTSEMGLRLGMILEKIIPS